MNDMSTVPVKQGVAVPTRSVFNPLGFSAFRVLQREIDRLFDDFSPSSAGGGHLADIKVKMDFAETKDGLELTVELPGLEQKDVEVTVRDGILTVSGEKTLADEKKEKNYHLVECNYGRFTRSISLPEGTKTDQIGATMGNGVLKVTIPTPSRPEARKIAVKMGA
jgi:HSP20 family protein